MATIRRKTRTIRHGFTTDSKLLNRLAANEEQAWIEFDRKYRDMICAAGRKLGIRQTDYDDLVQEVLLICCSRIGSFFYDRSKGHFRSFLIAIVRNVSWKMLRKNKPLPQTITVEYDDSIDRLFMKQYEQFLIEEVLKLLKERVSTQTYSAFEMLTLQQMSAEEVSRITRKSPATLYLIRHRCLRILRECIAEIPEAVEQIHSRSNSRRRN